MLDSVPGKENSQRHPEEQHSHGHPGPALAAPKAGCQHYHPAQECDGDKRSAVCPEFPLNQVGSLRIFRFLIVPARARETVHQDLFAFLQI